MLPVLPCVMLPNAFLCQALVRPIKLFKRCRKAAYCYCVDLFFSVYFSYLTSMQSRACLSCVTAQRLCVASCPVLEEQDGECSPFGLRGGCKAMGSPGRVEHQQRENRKRTYSNTIERSYSRLLSCWFAGNSFLGSCMHSSASPLHLSSSDRSCCGGNGKLKASTAGKSPSRVCYFSLNVNSHVALMLKINRN